MKQPKTIASLEAEKKRIISEFSRLGKALGMQEKRIEDFRKTILSMEQHRMGLIDQLKEQTKYLVNVETELNALQNKK